MTSRIATHRSSASHRDADTLCAELEELSHSIRSGRPFRAAPAVELGFVTDQDLRTRYVRRLPGIYQIRGAEFGPDERLRAVALWGPPSTAIAGLAAARLHGERMLSTAAMSTCVEAYLPGRHRTPPWVRLRVRNSHLQPEHLTVVEGIPCTSLPRTVCDLARWRDDDTEAIVAVDSLCRATGTPPMSLAPAIARMRPIRGVGRVLSLLPLCDHRADSPPETRLRLLIHHSPLPDPEPQVLICNEHGARIATADLGYRRQRVALFYDGGYHLHRRQRDWDSRVTADLTEQGWRSMRVTAGMLRTPRVLLRQIADLLTRQGHPVAMP